MATFKDSKGRDWHLEITVGSIEQVQKDCGIDLEAVLENKLDNLAALLKSARKLVSVAFCLCEEQAKKAGVAPEDFGRAIDGPALVRLRDAFLGAVTDFFQESRETLGELFKQGRNVERLHDQQTAKKVRDANPEAVLAAVESAFSKGPTSSGEKPE